VAQLGEASGDPRAPDAFQEQYEGGDASLQRLFLTGTLGFLEEQYVLE
jgi:hypothetical protein